MSETLRIATFNASLNRAAEGALIADLSTSDNEQAQRAAETIQRTNPDVVLVNEFDYDADGEAADLFRTNYVSVGQNGVEPVDYPYVYLADTNTGRPSGLDLNNDGAVGGPDDAFGFGFFPGQFGFVIYSKYPIDEANVRSFQTFLWKDMPDAKLFDTETGRPLFDESNPYDPNDPDSSFYTAEEVDILRLSSKNHVDVPIIVGGETVHILAAHPTPPVFDGPEDRNGKRNFDEIRFWTNYATPGEGGYIYDDQGRSGGLEPGARFVIVGDYNADPFDGDAYPGAADQFFMAETILGSTTDPSITPTSEGGPDAVPRQPFNLTHEGNPAFDTADFADPPGNLRVDYVLPSKAGFAWQDGEVFWLPDEDPLFDRLTGDFPFPVSDHRLLWADLALNAVLDQRVSPGAIDFLGAASFPRGLLIDGTEVGGLSGLAYDLEAGAYLALSDDRSPNARLYEIAIDLGQDGMLQAADVGFLGATFLSQMDGTPFENLSLDPEGIAITPEGGLVIASEGDTSNLIDPFIDRFTRDGVLQSPFEVDDKFLPTADNSSGIRNNLSFESLTITPSGRIIYTATENALFQDGAAASLEAGSPVRIVKYDAATGEALAEYIYVTEPVAEAPVPADGFATNGLVELLALDDDGSLLALERSFSVGGGNTIKLFHVRTQGATNVIGADAIESEVEEGELEVNVDELAAKELLLDLGTLGITLDNVEGMAFGPDLPDGRKQLILVSDNNFSATQETQFLAFALELNETPLIAPVLETPDELRYDPEPIVIAHRGASAYRPEHTLEGYELAIELDADFIEPDLGTTKDGVLVARHEPWLVTVQVDAAGNIVLDENGDPILTFQSTNVADLPEFADKLTVKQVIPGQLIGGWFAEDFTLAEIKQLRAREDQPDLRPESAAFDDRFEIPTLDEVIDLVQQIEAETGRKIGIYPETKEPTYVEHIGAFQDGTPIGIDTSEILIETLAEQGFTDPDRVFIQSFEIANLLELQTELMPEAGIDLPLVQLISGNLAFPTLDIAYNFSGLPGADPTVYDALGFVNATTTYGEIVSDAGLAEIEAAYAEGIGPSLGTVFAPGELVERAHDADLLVHAYTHRAPVPGVFATLEEYYAAILSTGVDGVFTDNPDVGRAVTGAFVPPEGPDSDDPAIYLTPEGAGLVVTAMKEGGLRVYDLAGEELFRVEDPAVRYNNVDLVYGLGDMDLVVASDREQDTIAIYAIGQDGTLTDVTGDVPASIFGVDDGEATAYGLATYRSLVDGSDYVFVTQADGGSLAQLALSVGDDGIDAEIVRTLEIPNPDGLDPEELQSEGIAIDRQTGVGYFATEGAYGLFTFNAEPTDDPEFRLIADNEDFVPDLEGVGLVYGEDGAGSIIVSSQGDSSFTVLDRQSYELRGSFATTEANGIDRVEESDGIDIASFVLPGFERGLMVLHDGSNEREVVFGDPEDDELQNFNTNFKYFSLSDALGAVGAGPIAVDFDPRDPSRVAGGTVDTMPQGVAAGDPTTDSAVLWARSTAPGLMTFEVIGPEGVVAMKTAFVSDPDEPERLTFDGLEAGTPYEYRVTDAAGTVETGGFHTAAEAGETVGLRFGVTGDWRGELSPYPSIKNADDADLDFFLLHGDTIYADFPSPALPQPQAETLAEFRLKYQEVYGERFGQNYWEDLRESTAVFATIDDHEVTNDFAGGATIGEAQPEFMAAFPGDDPEALVNDSTLYENGLEAFQEYHPIEEMFYSDTGDPVTAFERTLYRSQQFGDDAIFAVLDQRSFRDPQLLGPDITNPTDIGRFLVESLTLDRTLLGEAQLDELKADLLAAEEAGVAWKFVATPEPIQDLGLYSADAWVGYAKERTELLSFIEEQGIDNVVFVAADIHATFVNNLTFTKVPGGPQIASSAFEITTGSVAFDPPFGEAVIEVAAATGLLTPEQVAFYESLPIAPDMDGIPDDKDDFLAAAFQTIAIGPAGLDPIGLDDNLPQANGLIDATLLEGDYIAAHTFGWTEFDIDAETQALTVTTWGIESYSEAELFADPLAIIAREPFIVSKFVVNPQPNEILGTEGNDQLVGTDRRDRIDGLGGRDSARGGEEADVFVFDRASDGARDSLVIEDFEVGVDELDFGTASVVSHRDTAGGVYLFLEGDGDVAFIRGETFESLDL